MRISRVESPQEIGPGTTELATLTENPQGFPWTWLVAAIVIIAAANLVAVGIMKFRQKRE